MVRRFKIISMCRAITWRRLVGQMELGRMGVGWHDVIDLWASPDKQSTSTFL